MPTPPTSSDPDDDGNAGIPRGLKTFLVIIGLVVVAFIVVHLTVGGLGNHAR